MYQINVSKKCIKPMYRINVSNQCIKPMYQKTLNNELLIIKSSLLLCNKRSNQMKGDKNRKKPSSIKVMRPSIDPPQPPKLNQQLYNGDCNIKEQTIETIVNYRAMNETTVNYSSKEVRKETNQIGEKVQTSKELFNKETKSTKETMDERTDTLKDKKISPFSSSHSLNDLIISEFTIEEVNEILNCKLSDDEDNEFLMNDTNYTKQLLQQQFKSTNQTTSQQHLNENRTEDKNCDSQIKMKSKIDKDQTLANSIDREQAELNEKLLLTKNDLIDNLNSLDQDYKIDEMNFNLKSRFDHKFTNKIDSKLEAECLSEKTILNLRKIANHHKASKLANNVKEDGFKQIDELDDYERPICNLVNDLRTNDSRTNDLKDYHYSDEQTIENAISPPPEFDDKIKENLNGLHDLNRKTNDDFKNQLKRQINLNKNLQSRWSSVDLVQQHQKSLNCLTTSSDIVTPLPPPPSSFNGLTNNLNNKITNHHSSMLTLTNRPKLPTSKTKLDLLISTNKLTGAKKLPNKLKSLPEIFTSSKTNSSTGQKMINSISSTNKLIDNKQTNTFSSTSLISQIKIQQQQSQQNQTSIQQINQLAIRPLPPLPFENVLTNYSWFLNLEREEATSLLIKFGMYQFCTS